VFRGDGIEMLWSRIFARMLVTLRGMWQRISLPPNSRIDAK